MKKTFSIGGIHPNDSKISTNCPIEVLPAPSVVYISMAQHLGAPATPVVAAGDRTGYRRTCWIHFRFRAFICHRNGKICRSA